MAKSILIIGLVHAASEGLALVPRDGHTEARDFVEVNITNFLYRECHAYELLASPTLTQGFSYLGRILLRRTQLQRRLCVPAVLEWRVYTGPTRLQ